LVETAKIEHGGLERAYLFQRAAQSDLRPPVLIFLHGTGGTAAWAAAETGLPSAARARGYSLVVPEGLPPNPEKPPRFLTNPPRWNDGSTRPGDSLHSDADDVEFLDRVLDDVQNRNLGERVFLCGFSNGAGMTFRYAAERAEKLAAIAPVAGHCWVECPNLARPLRTLYILGTADPLIPLRGGAVKSPWGGRLVQRPSVASTLEKWAAANRCDPVAKLLREEPGLREEMYPAIDSNAEFRTLFFDGLGHHWPGGRGQLNPRIGGPFVPTLPANDAILSFFDREAPWN